MNRQDPYLGFRFRVEFDGIEQGGFSRLRGLERQTEVESYREGGVNDYEHKLVTNTTYSNLTLERGLVGADLWDWHEAVINGGVLRKLVTVRIQDQTRRDVWRWLVLGAYPVRWSGAEFNAAGSEVFVESVELAHHGIKRAG